jgi:hypothetical protein
LHLFFFFFLWVKISPLGNNNKKSGTNPSTEDFYFFEKKMAQFFRHIFEFLKKAEFGRFRS